MFAADYFCPAFSRFNGRAFTVFCPLDLKWLMSLHPNSNWPSITPAESEGLKHTADPGRPRNQQSEIIKVIRAQFVSGRVIERKQETNNKPITGKHQRFILYASNKHELHTSTSSSVFNTKLLLKHHQLSEGHSQSVAAEQKLGTLGKCVSQPCSQRSDVIVT